ncbi:MAG TPA: hypothetical protein VIV61_12600 [Candidatus Ozemobacteraceae bacterium]
MRQWACVLLVLALAGPVLGQQVKFIDTRLLLLAHPLFRQFSADTGRFAGTPSEPVPDGEEGIKRVQAELEAKRQEYAALPASWAKRLAAKMSREERASAEEAFLAEQQKLQDRVRVLEERLVQLRGVHGRPGLTSNLSMVGQAKTIANDIRTVVGRLRSGFGGAVIDISPLLPDRPAVPDTRIVYTNLNFQLWRGPFTPDEATVTWLEHAKRFLGIWRQPLLPVVYGGSDARLEAVKHLEQITGGK